jgi:hypothetical protein
MAFWSRLIYHIQKPYVFKNGLFESSFMSVSPDVLDTDGQFKMTDDWHEPLPPVVVVASPPAKIEEVKVEPVVELDDELLHFGEVVVETPDDEEYLDMGCCPDCGGYFSCNCHEVDDRIWEQDDDCGYEEDEEVPEKCPLCWAPNSIYDINFPYCSELCRHSSHDDDE